MKFPLMRNNILREDLDMVIKYLKQDDPILTHGVNVLAFEKEWSQWLGVKYSVFVNSGSSANLLTMAALKIRYPEGGEVIVPTLTWVSDIASVLQNGFTPIFVDTDPHSLGMNTKQVIEKLNNRTRAVFLTHVQGFNGLTDELIKELKHQNIILIEDVCESHGVMHNGCKAGSIGWIANFSFYYAHHMSTIEGGMISTNDEQVYQRLRMLRSHGMVREANDQQICSKWEKDNSDLNPAFIFAYPAYNMRNTEIGGIIGRSQLKRLDENIRRRNENFEHFLSRIDPQKYRTDFKMEGCSNYAFNLILKSPDNALSQKLMKKMQEAGIECRRGSSGGGNQTRQPYLKRILPEGHHKKFPQTEHIHFYGFYLGNFPDLSTAEINHICNVINDV